MSHACIYKCAMHIIHLKHACSEASIAMDVTEHDNAICKSQHAINLVHIPAGTHTASYGCLGGK